MAFLLRDQNQGIRIDTAPAKRQGLSQPFSFIRTLTVGFGITPNLLTPAVGIVPSARRSRASRALAPFTAGGDFHPALRTSASRNGWPTIEYASLPRLQQGAGGIADMTAGPVSDGRDDASRRLPERLRAIGEIMLKTRIARIRFRFVLARGANRCDQLWTAAALPVDGLWVPLRGFRKSHHLILAGPDQPKPTRAQETFGHDGSCHRRPAACVPTTEAGINKATRRHVPARRRYRFSK